MLATPTINKEYDVAKTGSTCNKYTSTGTVTMEPPPPIKPSVIPITSAAIYPITISIYELEHLNLVHKCKRIIFDYC